MDMTDSKKTNAFIWPLSAAAALLVALIAGIGARLETGAPPGLAPKPFSHLLGRPAPAFEIPGIDGETVSLASAGGAEAWLLYFTDAGCGACESAWPAVEEAAGRLSVIAIGKGDPALLQAHLGEAALAIGHDPRRIGASTLRRARTAKRPVDRPAGGGPPRRHRQPQHHRRRGGLERIEGRELMDRNALKPLPAGGILALGLIAALATGESPEDRDPQSSLLLRMVDEGSALLSRGTPAPDFELPDAAGENTVSLEDLKGESAAVGVRQLLLSVQPEAHAYRP